MLSLLFKECIDLNAQAILLMKEGRRIESSFLLRVALEKLEICYWSTPPPTTVVIPPDGEQDLAQQQQQQQAQTAKIDDVIIYCQQQSAHMATQQQESHSSSYSSHCGCGRGRPPYVSVPIDLNLGIDLETISADNVFTFYPRMFHFVSLEDATNMGHLKVFLILLCNQAVSRHINALLDLSSSNQHDRYHYNTELGRVLWLYERLVEVARRTFHCHDVQDMLCVITAACNNSGHIASHLMLFTETQQCISRVLKLLALSDDESSYPPEDLQIFFWSVCIFLEGRNLSNAPAA